MSWLSETMTPLMKDPTDVGQASVGVTREREGHKLLCQTALFHKPLDIGDGVLVQVEHGATSSRQVACIGTFLDAATGEARYKWDFYVHRAPGAYMYAGARPTVVVSRSIVQALAEHIGKVKEEYLAENDNKKRKAVADDVGRELVGKQRAGG